MKIDGFILLKKKVENKKYRNYSGKARNMQLNYLTKFYFKS